MLQHFVDDIKASSGVALRLAALATAAAFAMLVTTCFLCAAIFVVVMQRYGVAEACLAGAAVFLVAALIAVGSYLLYKRQLRLAAQRAALEQEEKPSGISNLLSDPAMLATALQVVRIVGVKRLVPLLALGGLAFGLSAGRRRSGKAEQ